MGLNRMDEAKTPLSRAQVIGTCSNFLMISYFTALLPDNQAPTCSSPMSRHKVKKRHSERSLLHLDELLECKPRLQEEQDG